MATLIRESTQNFSNFAQENLSLPKFINPLKHKYLKLNYDSYYGIDDYIILVKR
ncbi:MAG: hypothetical protein F6K22_17510 [Okeania sp. SIO2F4]|uniref:hypothetical protein n=1 Tax=Okeania sp. SIO2F4 TaxID=2607790 RepID=UPI00142A1FF4|nr:hypothetical protein [Okeania sp. SIO2F4]NES04467.1 hypothetical protein [Okeania sp. SIO2F4]